MWKLTHGMFDPEASMTEKFPGVPDSIPVPAPTPTTPQTTTLPNGARVVSQDMGGPVSAVALFVAAGSRNETPISSGVSFLLERMAFKGSAMRSKFRMTRDMERSGAIFNASAARETIAYSAEGLREKLPDMVSIITETATLPAAGVITQSGPAWDSAMSEIKNQTAVMKEDIENLSKDPTAVVTEAIHTTAFHGNTLGKFTPSIFLFHSFFIRAVRVFERECVLLNELIALVDLVTARRAKQWGSIGFRCSFRGGNMRCYSV